jgi:hypothetical protein
MIHANKNEDLWHDTFKLQIRNVQIFRAKAYVDELGQNFGRDENN